MIETHTAREQQTKTILIVEDDIEIGYFLAQALKGEPHYQVLFATDGFQALKMMHTLVPHLVLLDYLLPQVNGLEVAERVRTSEVAPLRQVPIILMSANMPEKQMLREDVMVLRKPFDLDALLTWVKDIVDGSSE